MYIRSWDPDAGSESIICLLFAASILCIGRALRSPYKEPTACGLCAIYLTNSDTRASTSTTLADNTSRIHRERLHTMGKGKMDEAAAARIRKARGDKDDFARRAQIAARANKETSTGHSVQGADKGGSHGNSQGGSGTSTK